MTVEEEDRAMLCRTQRSEGRPRLQKPFGTGQQLALGVAPNFGQAQMTHCPKYRQGVFGPQMVRPAGRCRR